MGIDFIHKVLVVEDEPTDRLAIVKMLENRFSDKNIYQAVDGICGFHLFEQYYPDIIFTDIRMPHMDGVQLIHEIRKIDPDIPIVVVSAFEKELFHLEDIKISNYILKPLTMVKLYAVIDKIIKG